MKGEQGFWNFLLLGTKGLTNSIHISLNKELLCCTPPGPLLFRFYPGFQGPFHSPWFLIFFTKGPTLGSSLQRLCPAPSRPSGAPQGKMHIQCPRLCSSPPFFPSGLSRLPSALFLCPHSPLHPLNPRAPLLAAPLLRLLLGRLDPALPYLHLADPPLPSTIPQSPCPGAPSLKPCFSSRPSSLFLFPQNCPINAQLDASLPFH